MNLERWLLARREGFISPAPLGLFSAMSSFCDNDSYFYDTEGNKLMGESDLDGLSNGNGYGYGFNYGGDGNGVGLSGDGDEIDGGDGKGNGIGYYDGCDDSADINTIQKICVRTANES